MPKIKCPVCGNEEFVEIKPPVYPDYSFVEPFKSKATWKACTHCGYVMIFDYEAALEAKNKK